MQTPTTALADRIARPPIQRRSSLTKPWPNWRSRDLLCFLIPALLPFRAEVIGNIFLPEVVLLITLPALLLDAHRRGVHRIPRPFGVLVGLWLVGQILADIYAETSFGDYSRGWANIGVFAANFAALTLLVDGQWNRIRLVGWGLIFGQLALFYTSPSVLAEGSPWKFGLAPPVTLAAVLLACSTPMRRHSWAPTALMLAFSLINLRLGFRTFAGVCFLTAIYLTVMTWRQGHMGSAGRQTVGRSLLVLGMVMLGGAIFIAAYSRAASAGLLGAQVREKYVSQHSSLGLLLSGRPQVLGELRAIEGSPLFGEGSWAANFNVQRQMRAELRQAGYHGGFKRLGEGVIEAHSELLGAWVHAGILGTPFWLWVALLIATVLSRAYRSMGRYAPLVLFVTMLSAWNLLFSPFAGEQRLLVAFYLLIMVMACNAMRAGRPLQDQES